MLRTLVFLIIVHVVWYYWQEHRRMRQTTNGAGDGQRGAGRSAKYRHYVFTWNNPPADASEQLRGLGPNYLLYQHEIGESGTPHLQGIICFANPRSFGAIAKGILGWHIESMRGTIQQAVDYCTKEATRDPNHPETVEEGTRPRNAGTAGGRSDLDAVVETIKAGAGIKRIADEHLAEFIKYNRGIERAIGLTIRPRDFKTRVEWYYGSTGSGKSRAAFAENPDSYWKNPSHHWWDGYEHQETVIVDDYRMDFCKFSELLRLFDRYPYQVQVKCGTREFVAKKIIITAPKAPEEMWANRTEEDLAQLTRRIDLVKRFQIIN